jgi:cytoskeletal protein RodZ
MTNPPNKDKLSSILKETRQGKGITLEMVHESTKIPLDALKAIEQGYSVHKLQTFYYRGFIKIYIKFLELDETQVLQEYGMLESAAPKPKRSDVKEAKVSEAVAPPRKMVKQVVRPDVKNDLVAKVFGQLVKVAVFLLVIFMVLKFSGCLIAKIKPAQKRVEVSKPVSKPVVKKPVKPSVKASVKESADKEVQREVSQKAAVAAVTEPSVENKSQDEKKPPVAETKSDKKSKQIELTVRATKNGWLQVKADGQVVFQSALKKGDSETWRAETEIELSGRNINLLEFELNGKMLGALGASDRGAKRVVFTKDGLSVKK